MSFSLVPSHSSTLRASPSALTRRLRLERLEERRVLDAGWVGVISGSASEMLSDMVGDAAGNTYLTGKYNSQPAMFGHLPLASNGISDIFVAKISPSGQFLWAVAAGDSASSNDDSRAIAIDAVGDVYITGSFEGTAQFGSETLVSAGGNDAFLAKLDGTTGQFLWARRWGGLDDDRGLDVTVDPTGNVIVTGGLEDSDSTSDTPILFVSKLTTAGAELWTSTVTGAMTGCLFSVEADSAGNVFVGGRFQGTAVFGSDSLTTNANPDGLIAKLAPNGQWLWARQWAGDTFWSVTGIAIGTGEGVFVSGQFEGTLDFGTVDLTSAGSRDLFVSQIDSATGEAVWARRMGGSQIDLGGDLEIDPLGNLNLLGTFRGTADYGPQTLVSDGLENAFIATLNFSGTFLEAHRFITGTSDPATGANVAVPIAGLAIDAAGSIYAGGWFSGGPIQLPQQRISGSFGTCFVVKLPPAAPTKFYVVEDAVRDRTYQYAPSGDLTIDNFTFNSTNTAPRGAASTAAGDKVWVVDANKKVYVYNPSGGLLGSWTAGSLPSNANVQGITTDGNNVWIVDAQSDKVYRYTGAASRLSGSQNAASSFTLNSGNKDATDLVTDGTSIWVLNNTTTDKVFKYTVSGTLIGSWTINGGGGSPTGLTIDPANVSYLWIVDNSSDRVYQFNEGALRTSGSQSPSTSFALAPGNTNPQGIADPPPAAAANSALPSAHDAALLGWLSDSDELLGSGKRRK